LSTLRLRQEGLTWRLIDDELVAVDVEGSTYLSANPSASLLWGALADGATHIELVDRLVERYGIEQQQAESDVDAFLEDLTAKGLLES
jgi:hypothetical protein